MKSRLETRLEHEYLIREEAKKRFPATDPDWFVKRWLDRNYDNAKKMGEAVAFLYVEIMASKGRVDGPTQEGTGTNA
jgi:hypothetical protein